MNDDTRGVDSETQGGRSRLGRVQAPYKQRPNLARAIRAECHRFMADDTLTYAANRA